MSLNSSNPCTGTVPREILGSSRPTVEPWGIACPYSPRTYNVQHTSEQTEREISLSAPFSLPISPARSLSRSLASPPLSLSISRSLARSLALTRGRSRPLEAALHPGGLALSPQPSTFSPHIMYSTRRSRRRRRSHSPPLLSLSPSLSLALSRALVGSRCRLSRGRSRPLEAALHVGSLRHIGRSIVLFPHVGDEEERQHQPGNLL